MLDLADWLKIARLTIWAEIDALSQIAILSYDRIRNDAVENHGFGCQFGVQFECQFDGYVDVHATVNLEVNL